MSSMRLIMLEIRRENSLIWFISLAACFETDLAERLLSRLSDDMDSIVLLTLLDSSIRLARSLT